MSIQVCDTTVYEPWVIQVRTVPLTAMVTKYDIGVIQIISIIHLVRWCQFFLMAVFRPAKLVCKVGMQFLQKRMSFLTCAVLCGCSKECLAVSH